MRQLTLMTVFCLFSIGIFAQRMQLFGVPLSSKYAEFKEKISSSHTINDQGGTFSFRSDFAGFNDCNIYVYKHQTGNIGQVRISIKGASKNDFNSILIAYIDKYYNHRKENDCKYIINDYNIVMTIEYFAYEKCIIVSYDFNNDRNNIKNNDF